MIIISLMLWIIDIDKDVLVNKEIINDNIEINYPYFNDNKIDNFINEYLDIKIKMVLLIMIMIIMIINIMLYFINIFLIVISIVMI